MPNVQGHDEGGIPKVLMRWRPQGNTKRLHWASLTWKQIADKIKMLGEESQSRTGPVFVQNQGKAIDAVSAVWDELSFVGSAERGHLINGLETACRQLSAACKGYGYRIGKQRKHLEHLVEVAAATVVGGAGSRLFSVVSLTVR